MWCELQEQENHMNESKVSDQCRYFTGRPAVLLTRISVFRKRVKT
jgi:hypothetical protein